MANILSYKIVKDIYNLHLTIIYKNVYYKFLILGETLPT